MVLDLKSMSCEDIFNFFKNEINKFYEELALNLDINTYYYIVLKKIEESKYTYNGENDYIEFLTCEIDLELFLEKYSNMNINNVCTSCFFLDYVKQISVIPLLNIRQEQALFRRLKRGDNDAKNVIFNCNLRLVTSEVNKNYPYGHIDKMDLIQEGNIGLLDSINRYDCEQGYKFSTYALYRIRRNIINAINKQKKIIDYPDYMYGRMFEFKKIKKELTLKYNREPSLSEIAIEMNLPLKSVVIINDCISDVCSLEAPVNDEGSTMLGDMIPDFSKPFVEDIEDKDFYECLLVEINNILSGYPINHQECIKLRCGLVDGNFMTLESVAKKIGITKEGVRQIVNKFYNDITESPRIKKML